MTSSAHINRRWQRQVRQRFDRAAAHYAALAQAQQRSADDLLMVLSQQSLSKPAVLADLGCGTGFMLNALLAQSAQPLAQVLAIDISEAMLSSPDLLQPPLSRICADVLDLPLASASVDVVLSNFALHWSLQPQAVMHELARVLSSQGLAVLAIPVVGSLPGRLVSAQQGEPLQTVARWQMAVEHAGLVIQQQQRLDYVDYFADADAWLMAVRTMGVTARSSGPTGLRGAHYLQALKARLEQERQPEGIPLTYQVWQSVLRAN